MKLRCVVVALVNVEFPHDFDFLEIVVDFPVQEIDFLEQFLLMELQFAHHFK
jgi:hypothetical protein